VDRGGEIEFARAYGLAHRAHRIPNTVDTRFGIASGTKGLTALAVVSLIDQGVLTLATTARSVLGDDLPLIDDRVTVEQLPCSPGGSSRPSGWPRWSGHARTCRGSPCGAGSGSSGTRRGTR